MSNTRKKYGTLSVEQAAVVMATASKLPVLIEPAVKQPNKFTPSSLLLSPTWWPELVAKLLVKGHPVTAQLDFDATAAQLNKHFVTVATGNAAAPKPLTGGEFRKVALEATRQNYAKAKAALKANPEDKAAEILLRDVKAILLRYGWTAKPQKRVKKAEVAGGQE